MPRFFTLLLVTILSFAAISCSSGNYRGYKHSPYTIQGQRYYPMNPHQALSFQERGEASWYDERKLFGLIRGTTAIGERFRPYALAGAHKTLPLPCRVRVTNLQNGKTTTLRINDRGPFIRGRTLDVTPRAASKLGFKGQGLAPVHLEVLSVGDGSYKIEKPRRRRFLFF